MGLERKDEDLVSLTIEGKFIGRVHRSSRFFISFKISDSDSDSTDTGLGHSHLVPVGENLSKNSKSLCSLSPANLMSGKSFGLI